MERRRIRDVTYAVQRRGIGPPLLLLHGFTGSSASWSRQIVDWERSASVVAPDFLGHGASDLPADPARYAMDQTLADLIGLLDQLELPTASVLGYSMGGRVALHLAAAHADRIHALILESSSPGIERASERSARHHADHALADRIEREGIEWFVGHWESLPLWASQASLPESVRGELRHQRLKNDPAGLANSLRGLGAGEQAPLHSVLPSLDVPALCIAGDLDTKYSDFARHLVSVLPRGELAIVPNAGHAVHLEQPQLFSALVASFLNHCAP